MILLVSLPPSLREEIKAQIIAEVCNLDKWTALWQGQGAEGVLFRLSKSFEKTKGGKKEESHSTLLSVFGASC